MPAAEKEPERKPVATDVPELKAQVLRVSNVCERYPERFEQGCDVVTTKAAAAAPGLWRQYVGTVFAAQCGVSGELVGVRVDREVHEGVHGRYVVPLTTPGTGFMPGEWMTARVPWKRPGERGEFGEVDALSLPALYCYSGGYGCSCPFT